MSRAIVTVKTSESFWHPLWEAHYLPHFDYAEIIPVDFKRHSPGFKTWQYATSLYNKAIRRLLPHYSLIVCVDVDEILVPDPEYYADFGDYLDHYKADVTECVGYGIMEMDGDKPIDLSQRITDQRKYWLRDPVYDKPVITKKRIHYFPGQHKCNTNGYRDRDLRMFHLRYADLSSFLSRRTGSFSHILDCQEKAVSIPEKWRVI